MIVEMCLHFAELQILNGEGGEVELEGSAKNV